MEGYKLTFKKVVSNTDLALFHNNIVQHFRAFLYQPLLQSPEQPGENHYIYFDHAVNGMGIIGYVIADQSHIGEVNLSIHVRHDKFIEPFSNWLQDEYGVSLTAEQPVQKIALLLARLVDKKRWSRDDWIYFFDCVVEKEKSEYLNSTPNFKALSDLIVECTNTVKTVDYIEKKYYQTYLPYKDGRK